MLLAAAVLTLSSIRLGGPWFLGLARASVDAARQDATSIGVHLEGRPLKIFLQSFAVQGSMVEGRDANPQDIGLALGNSFNDVSPGQAVVCSPSPATEPRSCDVRDHGFYVELNYATQLTPDYEVILTYKWGTTAPSGPRVSARTIRVFFEQRGEQWIQKSVELVGQS